MNGRQKGVVSLEASMVFAVMLPVVLLLIAVAAYFHLTFTARSIAENALQSMTTQTFTLGAGHQDFFLHADGQALKEISEAKLRELNQYLEERIGRIPGAVACAEIGHLGLLVHEQSGRGLASSKIRINGARQENFGFFPERPSSRCRGYETTARRVLTDARNDAENGGLASPTIFSVSSGLKGARLQADFGPSNIYDNPEGLEWRNIHGASEFLRQTMVIGSSVVVDLRATSLGRMMKKFGFSDGQLIIESYKFHSPRIDF